jgi:hypothetical protein
MAKRVLVIFMRISRFQPVLGNYSGFGFQCSTYSMRGKIKVKVGLRTGDILTEEDWTGRQVFWILHALFAKEAGAGIESFRLKHAND